MKKHLRSYFHFLRWGTWSYNDYEKYYFGSFIMGFALFPIIIPFKLIHVYFIQQLEFWINKKD